MSVLRQNEQYEQVEIMANNGPLCKKIKNDKENILKLTMLKRQWIQNGAFLKSLSISNKTYLAFEVDRLLLWSEWYPRWTKGLDKWDVCFVVNMFL